MDELISRQALLDDIRKKAKAGFPANKNLSLYAESCVIHAPTVDAVPVVRCKDCKDWGPGTGGIPICWETYEPMPPDGFCSIGERKEVPDESEEV